MAMIAGGRRKWARPNPVHNSIEAAREPFVLAAIGVLNPAKRPPRDWLVRHRLMRKHTTVTAAAPGVGKSTLAIEEAVSLASGYDFLGFGIDRVRKVAIINNEETRDELERRIEATCVQFGVPFADIAETLYLYSGIDSAKFVVACRGENDTVIVQPEVEELAGFLAGAGIDLLVIDPFVQAHRVSENQNEQIEQVMIALREIAVHANTALHLVHHTRKPPAGGAHQAGDIFAVRGGGAIVGDAHFVFTLADMGIGDSETLGVSEADRKFLRLDDAKGKLAPPSGARWFERLGVMMPYGIVGEQVGVLIPHQFGETEEKFTSHRANEVLKEIERRFEAGTPFSHSPRAGARYLGHYLTQHNKMRRKAADQLITEWLNNGVVTIEVTDRKTKLTGLKVLRWV